MGAMHQLANRDLIFTDWVEKVDPSALKNSLVHLKKGRGGGVLMSESWDEEKSRLRRIVFLKKRHRRITNCLQQMARIESLRKDELIAAVNRIQFRLQ